MALLNRAKVATATTGTGTVTLGSSVFPYQTLSSAGAVNGLIYSYLIEDGTDWEVGVGLYNSSTPSLTRTLTQSSTGSLLNLSGSATIAVAALGADISPRRRVAGVAGRYYPPDAHILGTGSNTLPNNTLILWPFSSEITLDALVLEVTTAIASSNIRMGLYGSDYKGMPWNLIEDAGTVSPASTGLKTLTLATPRRITDLFWLAAVADLNGIFIRGGTAQAQIGNQIFGNSTLNAAVTYSRFEATFSYAALPATTTGLTMTAVSAGGLMAGRAA